MWDYFWKALDIVKLLAILIICVWLVSIVFKLPTDETLKNVVLVIVGFYFGSSLGSKFKDSVITPSAPPPASPPAAS